MRHITQLQGGYSTNYKNFKHWQLNTEPDELYEDFKELLIFIHVLMVFQLPWTVACQVPLIMDSLQAAYSR